MNTPQALSIATCAINKLLYNLPIVLEPCDLMQAGLVLSQMAATLQPAAQAENASTELLSRLSGRELEVLEHVVNGLTTGQIAELLCISRHTVKAHLVHIFEKLEVQGRGQAVAIAAMGGMWESRNGHGWEVTR